MYEKGKDRKLAGVECVIDKDFASELLARELNADIFIMLTDADSVYVDWGTPNQQPIRRLPADRAVQMDEQGAFGEGSMAPKIRAAVDFVRRTKGRAIITSLSQGQLAVRGKAGTTITATAENE